MVEEDICTDLSEKGNLACRRNTLYDRRGVGIAPDPRRSHPRQRVSGSINWLLVLEHPSHADTPLLHRAGRLLQRRAQHGQLGPPDRYPSHNRGGAGDDLCSGAQVAALAQVAARATARLAGEHAARRPPHALRHRGTLAMALAERTPTQPKTKTPIAHARLLLLLPRATRPMADGLPQRRVRNTASHHTAHQRHP